MNNVSALLAYILGTTAGSTVTAPASIGVGTGRAATVTIAAYNSSTASAHNADYQCIGSGDETVINAAIAALPSFGGHVVLLEGAFVCTGAVVVNKSYVILEGQGNSATSIINPSSGLDRVAAVVVGSTQAVSQSGVKNLQVNSSGASDGEIVSGSGHGIAFACDIGILENVIVKAPAGDCFHIGQDQVAFATATTVASGSSGALPQSTLHVASTSGFASAGSVIVQTADGPAYCTYTATSGGNEFTGCSWSYPSGASLATSDGVTQVSGLFDLTAFNCYAQIPGGNGWYVDWTYGSCEFLVCRSQGSPSKPASTGSQNGWLLYGTALKLVVCHGYFWDGYGLAINAPDNFTGGGITVYGGEWENNASGGVYISQPSSPCFLDKALLYGNGITTGESDIDIAFGSKNGVHVTNCSFFNGGTGGVSQNIYMQASSYVYITDNEFQYEAIGRAVEIDGAGSGNACSYVYVRSNRCEGAFDTTDFVLLHGGVTNCEVSGNTTDASIVEATSTETPNYNIIQDNTLVPGYGATITTTGAQTLVWNNPGHLTAELDWSESQPSDFGLIAWNFDPLRCTTNLSAVNGTIYMMQIILRTAKTITNGCFFISSGATTATADENYMALVDSTGTIQASTASGAIDTATQSGGWLSQPFSAPYAAPAGKYYLAILANAGTPLKFGAVALQGSGGTEVGVSTASNFRYAVNGTLATALPGSFTLSSNTHTNGIFISAGVS